MKVKTLQIIFSLLLFNISFGQQIDTLKIIVLSPNKIEVSDNYLTEYNKVKNEVLKNRSFLKERKLKEKQSEIEEFNKQPDYIKLMFENELNFCDDLTIDNYISMVVREYISYRLYKPFKIKPRIVLVSLLNFGHRKIFPNCQRQKKFLHYKLSENKILQREWRIKSSNKY